MTDPWDSIACPYNKTATGWLGRKRKEMLNNLLLIRPTLGKNATRGIKLPPPESTFGMVTSDRTFNVQRALRGWDLMQEPRDELGVPPRKKVFHPSEDVLAGFSDDVMERPLPVCPIPDTTYGIRARPAWDDYPFADLISHKFQKDALEEIREGKACQHDIERANRPKNSKLNIGDPLALYENRACHLRKSVPVDKAAPCAPWRMNRFLKVPPHLSTFRSPAALEKAMRADQLESVGRMGYLGHGIPTLCLSREKRRSRAKLPPIGDGAENAL